MNHPAKLTAACFVALVLVASGDARAQFLHVHERVTHFAFAPYYDCPGVFDLTYCGGCGCYGCTTGVCVAPPPIIIGAPVLLGVPPVAPRFPPLNGAVPPMENFAARAMVPDVRAPRDALSEIRRRAAVLKPSTPEGRNRADRSISAGDTAFADQIYARATAKYREAIARAPDYAAAHFRLAHAYVATRQYNLALKSLLTALELSGSSKRDGFSLAEIYRGNKLAKRSHEEKLEDASLREPEDGGLKFLIAFTLNYGGNPLKAREVFRQSAQLDGAHQAYVRYFLPVTPVEEAAAPIAIAN